MWSLNTRSALRGVAANRGFGRCRRIGGRAAKRGTWVAGGWWEAESVPSSCRCASVGELVRPCLSCPLHLISGLFRCGTQGARGRPQGVSQGLHRVWWVVGFTPARFGRSPSKNIQHPRNEATLPTGTGMWLHLVDFAIVRSCFCNLPRNGQTRSSTWVAGSKQIMSLRSPGSTETNDGWVWTD